MNQSTIELRRVQHTVTLAGADHYVLDYVLDAEEIEVQVTVPEDGDPVAHCQTLGVDSLTAEARFENHALGFVREHGAAFGEVQL